MAKTDLSMMAKVSFVAHGLKVPSDSLMYETRNMSTGRRNAVKSTTSRQKRTVNVQRGFDSYLSLYLSTKRIRYVINIRQVNPTMDRLTKASEIILAGESYENLHGLQYDRLDLLSLDYSSRHISIFMLILLLSLCLLWIH